VVNVYYRISSSSYQKGKLPGASKEVCLRNFLETFPPEQHPFTILTDNCDEDTLSMVESHVPMFFGNEIHKTRLGNAGSFRRTMDLALERPDNEIIYFVEDDYLHLSSNNPFLPSNPARDLEEGLIRADYVTLYDHPDKYLPEYDNGEIAKIYRTLHTHWKHSISTTMTFAARVSTIREDWEIWMRHTENKHPEDHLIFTELHEKGRTLGVRIPGTACHVDLTYTDKKLTAMGQTNRNAYMEPWVFLLIEEIMAEKMFGTRDASQFDPYASGLSPGVKRLCIISALTNLLT
jgi:hypothetical protein